MRESHSKLLVVLESLLFLAPVTLLTIWYSWFLVGFYAAGLASEPAAAHVGPALILLGFAAQILAWWVVGVFILRGRQGLANLRRPFIVAIYLGAALAVAGGVSLALLYIFRGPVVAGFLVIYAFGLPALIPFSHIALERRRAAPNNSFKPKPLRGSASFRR